MPDQALSLSRHMKSHQHNSRGQPIWQQQVWHHVTINLSIYLYYKSWNNWKQFSPRLGPPYPSRRSHLSVQKAWRKGGRDWFRQCFPPKSYYFLHQQFTIPIFCTHILLFFSTHIPSFAYSLTHNSRHFFFWKDNNWHHCL